MSPTAPAAGPGEEVVRPDVGGTPRWVTLHHPASPPRAAVLLAAPFATEKVKAHRTLVAFARALAQRGLLAVRFDHRGEGDSGGDFADFGFIDRLADLDRLITLLAQERGLTHWGGVGLRLGANLLAAAAARHPGRHPLSLWSPVADGDRLLQELLHRHVVEQGLRHGRVPRDSTQLLAALHAGEPIVVEGFPLTRRLLDEAALLQLSRLLPACPGPLQWLELDHRDRPLGPLEPALAALPQIQERTSVLVGSRFWQNFRYHRPREPLLFAHSLRFLEETLAHG